MEKRVALVTPLASKELIDSIACDIIGIDAGTYLVMNHPNLIASIGDYDSCSTDIKDKILQLDIPVKVLNPIKDETDTKEGIDLAIKLGYKYIDIYGGIAKRIDHSIANLLLFYQYDNIRFIDDSSLIQCYRQGKYSLNNINKYNRFSIFSLIDSEISINNAAYNLDHYLLKLGDPLGVSNQFKDDEVNIEVHKGKIIVICINENK